MTQPSEPVKELVRQYIVDNIRTNKIQGYDPNQTDQSASDFLPVSTDWSLWGDVYPIIVVQQPNGPSISGGGETNATSTMGDGSGVNQRYVQDIVISVQSKSGLSYRNSVSADELAHDIYWEIHNRFKNDSPDAIIETSFTGVPTPPTVTKNQQENDSGSTSTWIQYQGTVPVSYKT